MIAKALRLAFMMAVALAGVAADARDPLTIPPDDGLESIWLQERGPQRVHGRSWLVGSATVNVMVIDSGDGLVLIDGGPAHLAPLVERNLAQLGLSIHDVKLILSSEPHYDHAGALAALVRGSNAVVLASPAAAAVLRTGAVGADDPQRRAMFAIPPVTAVQTVGDGETVRLGTLRITAHALPGHTAGSMGWAWTSCVKSRCSRLFFAPSLSPRTDGDYRFSDPAHAGALKAFRQSIRTMAKLRCDIVITAHPVPAPLPQKGPCQTLAARANADLARQLQDEQAQP